MNVLMNLLEYNEYHVNINLTKLLSLEQMMMDKESLFKQIRFYGQDYFFFLLLLFWFYQIND